MIFGGDGTVHRHLAEFANTDIPVLAVPCGSGNDLARVAGTGTAGRALLAWQKILEGTALVQATDLGVISAAGLSQPRYFSCCANVGMDADAARRTDSMPDALKSRGGYFIGGLMALASYKPRDITIQSDSGAIREPGWFVSVSNTPTYGGGLNIAPQASVTDGQLDITFAPVRHFSRASLAGHFPKIFSGRHVEVPELNIFQTKTLTIETPAPQDIYADGEFISQTPCQITIAPGALRLVTARVR